MLETRAGCSPGWSRAQVASAPVCDLTRATFLAKTNSTYVLVPLQHEVLLPRLREGRGRRSDAKVLIVSAHGQTETCCLLAVLPAAWAEPASCDAAWGRGRPIPGAVADLVVFPLQRAHSCAW